MNRALLILSCVGVMSMASVAAAQTQPTPMATPATPTPMATPPAPPQTMKPPIEQGSRFVRTLTNVQVELTLTDQLGAGAPQKKTVSMIVSSGNWGKIRNSAVPSRIGLNVDARPFVSVEGPVQLELTLYYYPPQGDSTDPGTPTELNQSLTVVLQSGKPLMISQSADPASDRKVNVEVKATVLK